MVSLMVLIVNHLRNAFYVETKTRVLIVYDGPANEAQVKADDAETPAPPPTTECLTPQSKGIATAVCVLVVNV